MSNVRSATLTLSLKKSSVGTSLSAYADFASEESSAYFPQDDRTEWIETRPITWPAGETCSLITITQQVVFDGAGGCTLSLEQPQIIDVTDDYA